MICSEFSFSKKVIEIRFDEINNLTGGIFDGIKTKPIKIYDGKNNLTINFSYIINNYSDLVAHILRRIKSDLFDQVVERMEKYKIRN